MPLLVLFKAAQLGRKPAISVERKGINRQDLVSLISWLKGFCSLAVLRYSHCLGLWYCMHCMKALHPRQSQALYNLQPTCLQSVSSIDNHSNASSTRGSRAVSQSKNCPCPIFNDFSPGWVILELSKIFYRLEVNLESSRCDGLKLFDLLVGLEVQDDQEQEWAQDLDKQVHPEDVDPDVVRVLPQPREAWKFKCTTINYQGGKTSWH